jgi:acetyltransferase-like isoleucine patch superfamily enzyme
MISRTKKAFRRIIRTFRLKKGIYCRYGKGCIFKEGVFADEETVIGNYNFIGRFTTITKTNIGSYCSIAPFVTIGPGEHDLDSVSTSERINAYKTEKKSLTEGMVIIGNDVWIGTNVVVLRNVRIGDGAVLAAGSVVTKDVPAYAIVGGIPAKIIRYREAHEKKDIIRKSAWWDYKPEIAVSVLKKEGLLK